MDRNIGWFTTAVFLAFGGAFFLASLTIPGGTSTTLGPAVVPRAVSLMMVILAAIVLVADFRTRDKGPIKQDITPRDLLFRAGPLIALIAVYGQFMLWFGYLIATLLSGYIAFRLFGNSRKASALHSILAGTLFYFCFVYLLGIYDPPGSLIDMTLLF